MILMPKTIKEIVQQLGGTALYGKNADDSIGATTCGSFSICFSTRAGYFTYDSGFVIFRFFWHPTNPWIFFTCEADCINVHQICEEFESDDSEIFVTLGVLDMSGEFTSIALSKSGDLMLVILPEQTCAKLVRLTYSEGSIDFLYLEDQTIQGDEPILACQFFGERFIAFLSDDENGTVKIHEINPATGEVVRRILDDEDLSTPVSCLFSQTGSCFVVLSSHEVAFYHFSKTRFELPLVEVLSLDSHAKSIRLHPTLPLLIVLLERDSGENFVQFFKLSRTGLEIIYQFDFDGYLDPEFYIDGLKVMFGYYIHPTNRILTIDFEDLVHFPVTEMLSIRYALSQYLPDDLVECFLLKRYKTHLSLDRFASLFRPSPPKS